MDSDAFWLTRLRLNLSRNARQEMFVGMDQQARGQRRKLGIGRIRRFLSNHIPACLPAFGVAPSVTSLAMRRMAHLEGGRKSCAFRYMFFRQSPYA